jgi:hypothetical protein
MTTLSNPALRPRHAVPPGPDYAVRRAVAALVVVVAILLVAAIVPAAAGAVSGLGGTPAVASETAPTAARLYVAGPGDSLWSIAEHHRGGVDHDRYLDALISLNGGTGIHVGQAVRLP